MPRESAIEDRSVVVGIATGVVIAICCWIVAYCVHFGGE